MTEDSLDPIVVYGAGGFGRRVLQLLIDINAETGPQWDIRGFVDDAPGAAGTEIAGLRVLGDHKWLLQQDPPLSVALGLGAPRHKARIAQELAGTGVRLPTLVHPSARVGHRVTIGAGSIVCAGNILTCDIAVGDFVTINLACTVGHDARIGRFVTMAPGVHVSGSVEVDEGAEIGTGAAIIQQTSIGRWSVLGAGAVAVRSVSENSVAVGVPAKEIRHREEGWQND